MNKEIYVNIARLAAAKDAYAHGHANGYSICDENYYQLIKGDSMSVDEFIYLCLNIESDHFRQFSPFEFYANEYNNSYDPDFTWDCYDRGVYRGIVDCIKDWQEIK